MNILITGSRAPVALEFARRMHRAGHYVFVADSLRHTLASCSNSVKRSFMIPAPAQAPREFADALSAIVNEHQIDYLIPTCEEVFFISNFRDQLNCSVLVDGLDKLAAIHNKWTFSQMCPNQFAQAPKTILIPGRSKTTQKGGSEDEMSRWSELCERYPELQQTEDWVFKPVYSRFASRTLVGPSANQLATSQREWRDNWIAQRRIRGMEYSTYSIARHGEMLAHVTYHSLYRAGLGSGICFQPLHIPVIENFVQHFIQQHQFHGQIGFDLMMDQHDRLWVLEGNPRATSGGQLFGVADRLDEALLMQAKRLLRPASCRPAMVEFAMPLWGAYDALTNGKWEFPVDMVRARWLTTSWRDIKPTLNIPRSIWEIARIARIEQCSLQQASTRDIEWNGAPM